MRTTRSRLVSVFFCCTKTAFPSVLNCLVITILMLNSQTKYHQVPGQIKGAWDLSQVEIRTLLRPSEYLTYMYRHAPLTKRSHHLQELDLLFFLFFSSSLANFRHSSYGGYTLVINKHTSFAGF